LTEPTVEATLYEVSLLPSDWAGPDGRYHWVIRVEKRSATKDSWGVFQGNGMGMRRVLGPDGSWHREGSIDTRDEAYLAANRYPLAVALEMAKAAAPGVSVNGWTAAHVLANPEWNGDQE
jgi:hypothetical protein